MIVYRKGSRTPDNLTPRPERDLEGRPGQAPGLSTSKTTPEPTTRACMINLDQLKLPLRGIPDDPSRGGTAGHVAIVPVRPDGEVDHALLAEWASSRGTSQKHRLTEILENAIVPGTPR